MANTATAVKPQNYNQMTQPERRALRLRYIEAQGGACYQCGEPLTGEPHKNVMGFPIQWSLFPPNFERHPVHLHHNHTTGETIGAVHARCNAYLWQYHGH